MKKFQPPHPRLLSPCHLPPSCFFFFFSLSLYPSTPSQTPIHTNSCIVSQTNSLLSVPSAPSPLHPARHINPSAAARHPGTDTSTSTFAIMLWKSRSKTDGLQVKKKKRKRKKRKEKRNTTVFCQHFCIFTPSCSYIEGNLLCVKCCTWRACCLTKFSCRLLNAWRDSVCVKCLEGN